MSDTKKETEKKEDKKEDKPDPNTKRLFNKGVDLFRNLPNNIQPNNEEKLRFHALLKQSMVGPCNVPRPPFMEVVNRAKWDAWKSLKEMPKTEAMKKYLALLEQFLKQNESDPQAKKFLESLQNYEAKLATSTKKFIPPPHGLSALASLQNTEPQVPVSESQNLSVLSSQSSLQISAPDVDTNDLPHTQTDQPQVETVQNTTEEETHQLPSEEDVQQLQKEIEDLRSSVEAEEHKIKKKSSDKYGWLLLLVVCLIVFVRNVTQKRLT
eukprot:Lithocolla_globosa_v1_NODE_7811_length_898_cov_9.988138.p1 type:complete len:267 gc:universal NODE_7811_length_898_cov_9.988138:846-46(-)